MVANSDEIIRKYRSVARLPDFLFAFTFPMRRKAVHRLQLQPAATVLEIGCGSGANFRHLIETVGLRGRVTGVDISPDMIAAARERIDRAGWSNITVMEGAAETVVLPDRYDGLLLFAMHDVLTSPLALDNILSFLKPGARVVSVGPRLIQGRLGFILNPLINAIYSRFAVSTADRDCPYRLLAERIPNLEVEEHGGGAIYLASGVTC